MEMAIEVFNKGQFPSKTACAQAFDVPSRTLRNASMESPLANNLLQIAKSFQILRKQPYLDGF